MKRLLYSIFGLACILVSPHVGADTLYLNDGSVLKGTLTEDNGEVVHLENPLFGFVQVYGEGILYQESDSNQVHVESFTLVDNGTWILNQMNKPVPERKGDSTSFRMMIPGTIQALRDSQGQEVPFTHRVIGGNSLITVHFDDMATEAEQLTITTLRAGLVFQESSGEMAFRLKYIPAREQRTKIILRYPTTLTQQDIQPPPLFTGAGLVIWEQDLQRQQQFKPEIVFTP